MGNGNFTANAEVERAVQRAQRRVGRLPVQGRCNRLPRRFEDDYDLDPLSASSRRSTISRPYSECSQDSRLGVAQTVSAKSQDSRTSCPDALARSKHTGASCVVKRFNLKNMRRGMKKELGCEIETLLSMDHPHLARLVEVYESEHDLVLVMEHLEGDDLRHYLLERGSLSEKEAAQMMHQMLLATNYMHEKKIVHGSLDLDKFTFDRQGSEFLKLSDLGFSKFFKKDATVAKLFDALGYDATEKQGAGDSVASCDIWSLGVIAFTFLSGESPLPSQSGEEIAARLDAEQDDLEGRSWGAISPSGLDFVRRLLSGDPSQRLTAAQALAHPWLKENVAGPVESSCGGSPCGSLKQGVRGLVSFAKASQFQKACARLMAWTLSLDECVCVRTAFLALDKSQIGVIKLMDLKEVLVDQCGMPKSEFLEILHTFNALDARSTEGVINYSDFRAAMISGHIGDHDATLKDAFRRFDADGSGYITEWGLKRLLGGKTTSKEVQSIIAEVDLDKDGRISKTDFMSYLRATPTAARSGARGCH